MSQNRPTKEIITTNKHKIVYYEYATGRDYNAIQEVYLKDAKLNMIGKDVRIEGFNPNAENEANKIMFSLLVVSVDDQNEGVADKILDLPVIDYNEVIAALNEISGKKKIE